MAYRDDLNKLYDDLELSLLKNEVKNTKSGFYIKNDILSDVERIIKKIELITGKWDLKKVVSSWIKKTMIIHDRRVRKDNVKAYKVLKLPTNLKLKKIIKKDLEVLSEYNVGLIKTVNERLKDNIKNDIYLAIQQNKEFSIREIIKNRIGTGHRNFKLIARDQTLKFNRSLTLAKAKHAGYEEFIYRSSRDEKVRKTHAVLDGKRFEVDSSNAGNNALNDINCRCSREFVLEF
jgi:SPP1 gp7 family putative phage head morphogenesis protein